MEKKCIMYTTDSEPHTSVTRLLGGEKEQLTKNITVYISSGSRTDETSFLKIQTHNTIFVLSSTCLAIHADRHQKYLEYVRPPSVQTRYFFKPAKKISALAMPLERPNGTPFVTKITELFRHELTLFRVQIRNLMASLYKLPI